MNIMFKFENAEYDDEQVIKQCLENIPEVAFETISEDGIDGVSLLIIIVSSGALTAVIKAVEKIYSTKIKSINDQQYCVKITKDGCEIKAPTLDETRKLLRDAANYKERFDNSDN